MTDVTPKRGASLWIIGVCVILSASLAYGAIFYKAIPVFSDPELSDDFGDDPVSSPSNETFVCWSAEFGKKKKSKSGIFGECTEEENAFAHKGKLKAAEEGQFLVNKLDGRAGVYKWIPFTDLVKGINMECELVVVKGAGPYAVELDGTWVLGQWDYDSLTTTVAKDGKVVEGEVDQGSVLCKGF